MENKQEPKISTGLAVHTNLVAGEYREYLPIQSTPYNDAKVLSINDAKVLSIFDMDKNNQRVEKLLEKLRTADA